MKNWFLVAVLALGLMLPALYASPPDPGGPQGLYLDQSFPAALGTALAVSPVRGPSEALKASVTLVLQLVALALGLLLVALIAAPYFNLNFMGASTVHVKPPERGNGESFGLARLAKRTKSPVLKMHSA